MISRPSIAFHIINHLGVAIASKLVPVASVFLYSHWMSIQDYGVLSLAASYLWIFGIIVTLNLHTGVGRYIYTEHGDFESFLGTTIIAITAIFAACSIIVFIGIETVEPVVGLPRSVLALLFVVVAGSIAESIFTQISIHEQKSALLVRVITSKALGTLVLSIALLFFVIKHEKYFAVLIADAFVSFLLVVYVLRNLQGKVQWHFGTQHLAIMAKYSIPLIPYMLGLTLLSQFDRVMIDHYFGKEATGLYSLAYSVGILLQLATGAVLNAMNPPFFDAANQKDFRQVLRDSDGIFAFSVFATTMLVLFGESIFSWLVPEKYGVALDLIPVVAIGGLSLVVFQIWVRVIAYANQTYLISVIAVVAIVLKIWLNTLLLPIYGYKVAAITTIVAYLFMALTCVAAVNFIVRLLKVSIRYELAYVSILAAITLFFRYAHFPFIIEYLIKAALLVFVCLSLRARILNVIATAGRRGVGV